MIDKDVLYGLLVILGIAFVFAVIRSIRMSLAKLRQINEKRPSSQRKIEFCPGPHGHYFPVVKRGRLAKCRYCPKTLRRP